MALQGNGATTRAAPSALVRYLRACYDAENHATSITQLFHPAIRYLQFVSSPEQLLTGERKRVAVGRWDARAAAREAALYPREKSLLYTAFPLIGRVPKGADKRRPLCAPLLIYPATLVEEEQGAFVEVDLTQQMLNLPVLSELVAATAKTELDIETLVGEFPRAPFDEPAMEKIVDLLERRIPQLDALSLNWFPRIKDAEFVRAVAKRPHAKRPICLAACAVGLFPNSLETRGVMYELGCLAGSSTWSAPLRQLFEFGNSDGQTVAPDGTTCSTDEPALPTEPTRLSPDWFSFPPSRAEPEKSQPSVSNDRASVAVEQPGSRPTVLTTERPRRADSARGHAGRTFLAAGKMLPWLLSTEQQKVLQSAALWPLTLVIGPPGTGKSCTIAAIALDHLLRGQSVLIACRKQQAVDVVASKLTELLGPMPGLVCGGDPQQLRQLKHSLAQLLDLHDEPPQSDAGQANGGSYLERDAPWNDASPRSTASWPLGQSVTVSMPSRLTEVEADCSRLRRQLRKLEKSLFQFEADLPVHFADEAAWARGQEQAASDSLSQRAWRRLQQWWLAGRLQWKPPVWRRLFLYQQQLRQHTELCQRLIQAHASTQLRRGFQSHRDDLTCFLRSLRTRSSSKQRELFQQLDCQALFKVFPIWLTTLADISQIVPLHTELFDVVIFDEATQCDLASSLPLLQRARRAVIVGDPQQLRHVSFLSDQRITQIARHFELDPDQQTGWHYRARSLFDRIKAPLRSDVAIHFLNEHFRSLPQIIAYSNQHTYDNRLWIMRQNPMTQSQRVVFTRWVPDAYREAGVNPREGAALIDELLKQIEKRRDLPDHACQTIGVLSPFREQVDWLNEQLQQSIPAAIRERHRLRVGTTHAFQGEERDLMFLSLAIAPPFHSATLRFLESPELLNVSLTRARHQQFVFHSVPADELPKRSRVRRYLEWTAAASSSPIRSDQKGADKNEAQHDSAKPTGASEAERTDANFQHVDQERHGQRENRTLGREPAPSAPGNERADQSNAGGSDRGGSDRQPGIGTAGSTDPFLDELESRLRAEGLRTWRHHELAGIPVDLVVVAERTMLGIDLIGGPARSTEPIDLERYRRLQRAGVSGLPLFYARWEQDRSACLAAILQLLRAEHQR
jgi:hypothetical protein